MLVKLTSGERNFALKNEPFFEKKRQNSNTFDD